MGLKDVTVIGAGIVGVATAIYLQRDGHRVAIVDKADPGRGTSFGNAGSIAPSSIVPMALPGTLRNVPKWVLDPLGPLTLSWRQVPALLPWFLHFRRACAMERAQYGARALKSINGRSIEAYTELLASIGVSDLLRRDGMLHVYRSRAAYDASATARRLRIDNRSVVEEVDAARLLEMEPALSPEYTIGFFLPDNGHVRNPLRLVQVLAEHFVANGGRIERAAVHDFEVGPDGPVALVTDSGNMPVDHVVIAAGAASQKLAARLGTRIPIAPERGYHIEIAEPGIKLRMPVTDGEVKFVATPMENGLRLAGTSEFRSAHAPANWARAKALAALGPRMLPQLKVDRYSEWMGTRPSTPDSLPIVGPAPRCKKVFFAFGHGHFGLMAAPPTGQLISDLVAGRSPRIDITPFRADRFG